MANKVKDVAEMSDQELMDAWTQLGADVEAGKARLREFSHEHQKRTRLAQLGVSAADLALLQETSPEYIESQEKVNG